MSEIRDPIYGFIEPNETEFKIINSPIFQRLRRIKQLALTNLVYPTANHTRFDHSLGVLHVAKMMAKKLLPGEDKEEMLRIVRFAALLHDIGHGPFSHVSEYLLRRYSQISGIKNVEEIHEKITAKLIETNKDIGQILSANDIKQIIGLLSGKSVELSLMKEIISGPLDADKQDYLLRDSYFCGVKYGVYDIHRMINTLDKHEDNGDQRLCITHDGVNALEQFILAKYYMIKQVYYHKTRVVSDAMLIRGVELGIDKDDIDFLKKLYIFEDTQEYLEHYLNWWDDKFFVDLLSDQRKGYANNIFKKLFERNLFKTIYSKDLKQIPSINVKKDLLLDINDPDNYNVRRKIEDMIANKINVEPEYVIINSIKVQSVREMTRDSEGFVQVKKRDGMISNFVQESAVFRSIDESLKETTFEVYAPMSYSDRQDKNKKKKQFELTIEEILKEIEAG